jgi:hypothetical protein
MATDVFVPVDDEEDGEVQAGAEPTKDDDARDDLIAAAEAALKSEGQELEQEERDEKGRFKPKPPQEKPKSEKPKEEAKPQDEKPSSVIARELAKRNERREAESSYKAKVQEADQVLARAREAAATLEKERAELAREREEIQRFKTTIQRDPMAAMKEVGWTADQFINNAERARDPNYQEIVSLRGELSKRDEVITRLTSRLDRLDEVEKKYATQAEQQQAEAEVKAFWSSIPEGSPVFNDDRYDDEDDILTHAKKVRQKYFDKTGKVASPQEVGQYLHYQALKRREGVPAETAGRKPGQAGQTKAKVSRALGSSDAQERRGSNGIKHVHDMSADEERQYLMDVAENALAADD